MYSAVYLLPKISMPNEITIATHLAAKKPNLGFTMMVNNQIGVVVVATSLFFTLTCSIDYIRDK